MLTHVLIEWLNSAVGNSALLLSSKSLCLGDCTVAVSMMLRACLCCVDVSGYVSEVSRVVYVLSLRVVSCLVVSCRVVSCRIVSCRVVSG